MLPWLFAVLLVVNGVVFIWGYQREKSLEPELPPVPKGQYDIVLLSEQAARASTAEAPAEDTGNRVRPPRFDFGPPPFQPAATSASPEPSVPRSIDPANQQSPMTAVDAPVEATAGAVDHTPKVPAKPAATAHEQATPAKAHQPKHKAVKDNKEKSQEAEPKPAGGKLETTSR